MAIVSMKSCVIEWSWLTIFSRYLSVFSLCSLVLGWPKLKSEWRRGLVEPGLSELESNKNPTGTRLILRLYACYYDFLSNGDFL